MAYGANSESLIFCQTTDKTVTNTVTKTSALGTGVGSQMIRSESITPGRRIRIHGEGIYSAPLLLGSLTIRVELGGTVIASVVTSSLGISGLLNASNKAFTFDCLIVFRTVGVSGKAVIGGGVSYSTGSGTKVWDDIDNSGSEVTINTTNDMTADVTVQWDSASTSRSVKTTIATIMLV